MKKNIFDPTCKVVANFEHVKSLLTDKIRAPLLVEVDPSNTCNHGCHFCISSYIHLPESRELRTYDKSIMSRDTLMNLCQDFIEMRVGAINWTGGGEPTINPHLKEAITYVGEKSDIKMGIFTNGTLLHVHNLFEVMVKYFTWVRFSIDAGSKETYNSIRRTRPGQGWNRMMKNLVALIEENKRQGSPLDIGVGFVITPDNYLEMLEFAHFFKDYDISYAQFKPEVVNKEREDGAQRTIEFWEKINPFLKAAREVLGDKFQVNQYKLTDLVEDPVYYGRTYKKCLGSQISPCVGADGHVYVCPNLRGYEEYSYGSLHDRRFKDIWNDIEIRRKIMHYIEDVERFSSCTKLCKPHESNKALWDIYEHYNSLQSEYEKREYISRLESQSKITEALVDHKEFI